MTKPEPFLSTAMLEQFSNEQVGAACKALMRAWVVTADECREGESLPKLINGFDDLLELQGMLRDTEFNMHLIGYCDNPGRSQHDRDQFETTEHHYTAQAGKALTTLVRYVLRHVTLTGHHW